MHRFFLPLTMFQGDEIIFPAEQSHQIHRVLRLKQGQHVLIMDGLGREDEIKLTQVAQNVVRGVRISSLNHAFEEKMVVRLYPAMTQRDKFEWVLQKCTEIGVSFFIPVICARSIVHIKDEKGEKIIRWGKIIQEAAEQSGRVSIPTLYSPLVFKEALLDPPQNSLKVIAWENEQHLSLKQAIQEPFLSPVQDEPKVISILIGPEGGFANEEVQAAIHAGWMPVSLGKNILRMETAAIVAVTLAVNSSSDL